MKKIAHRKKKNFLLFVKNNIKVIPLSILLIIGFVMFFIFGRTLPNDKIYYAEGSSVAMLLNENPKFNVSFGNVNEPERQWLRFEAESSINNPFEKEGLNIFQKIYELFMKKDKKGIEMSLIGVDVSEVENMSEDIKNVAELLGEQEIKTATELTELGRELGSYEGNVSKKTVRNINVVDGIDLEYQILEGYGVKEEIVIKNLEEYNKGCKKDDCKLPFNQFEFEIVVDEGVIVDTSWYTVEGKSSQIFYFLDEDGRYIAHFLPTWAIDSAGNKTYDVNLDLKKVDEKYLAIVTVNPEWLLSKDRIFPVRIDPSIVHDDKENFDTGMYERTKFASGYKLQLISNPSGLYTSDEVSLGSVTTLNSITWTPVGVNTGDAETPYSTTDLIGQWDFNETSGTTADNEGSCGASCDGTLTSFASTGSQDAAAGTGWTANNRRWGAGAVMLDGANDYIACTDANCGGTSYLDMGTRDWTVAAWIKTKNSSRQMVVQKGSATGQYSYALETGYNSDGKPRFSIYNTADGNYITTGDGPTAINDGFWHYVVGTYDGTSAFLFVDGVSVTSSIAISGTQVTDSTSSFEIGTRATNTLLFNGVIDTVRVYARALSQIEIASDYQSGNIEFEYRTSADGSSWSSWTGGTEVSVDTLDYDTNYGDGADGALAPTGTFNLNSSTSGARSYADGIAYKVASNPTIGGTSIVTVDTPNGLATGDDILLINLQGAYTDFLDVGNYEILTISSVDTGTKTITTTTNIRKTYQGTTFSNQKIVIQRVPNYTSVTLDNTDSITATAWNSLATAPSGAAGYYTGIVAFKANGTVTVGSGTSITASSLGYEGGTPPSNYVGGKGGSSFCGAGGIGGVNGGTTNGTAGAGGGGGSYSGGDGAAGYCGGGGSGAGGSNPGGAGSVRQGGAGGGGGSVGGGGGGGGYGTNGTAGSGYDASGTAGGIETSGAGATGSSANRGNGGGGGGTYGYTDLRRLYYGSGGAGGGGYTSAPGSGGKGGGIILLYVDTITVSGTMSSNGANGTNGGGTLEGGGGGGAGGSIRIASDSVTLGSSLVTASGGTGGTSSVGAGGTGGSGRIYIASTSSISGTTSPTATTEVVESVLVSEGTESQSIPTSDSSTTYQLSVKDVSTYTKIPFWVASDTHGNVGDIIYGESLFANYQPDGNTIGFWHMDEAANDSCNGGEDVCDSSRLNYDGTETGTDILTSAYIGSGRTFSAGDDISLGNQSLVDGLANMTVDAWIYPTAQASTHYRMFNEQNVLLVGQYGTQVSYYFGNGSSWTTSETTGGTLRINGWNYVAWVKSGTSASIYINGQLSKSGITAPATLASTTAVNYISTYNGTDDPWIGNLDEVRISNVARTTTEIKQAYEIGSRTHPINIYFKADLQSGNLIANTSDKSFSISEILYGTVNAIENLNVGDKIIVTESTYKAQGTVDSIDTGTGAVTVSSWDTGSTAPGGGYTTDAAVYKWQREFVDTRWHLSSDIDGVSTVTFNREDSDAVILLDDFKAAEYSSDYTATAFTPIDNIKYVQYRAIFSTWDKDSLPYLTSVQMDYDEDAGGPTLDLIMRHGRWFNSNGEKQPFWWVD